MSEQEPKLTNHVYDGIQEYDNPTPGWWTWIFVASIVFSGIYWITSTLAMGDFSANAYFDRAMVADMKKSLGEKPLPADAPTLLKLAKSEDMRAIGAGIYATNCASCHGKDGAGVTGPNMTDEYYINVTKLEDIVDIIKNGRNNGAMPAWSNRLQPNEIVVVSAYMASLRGQNKPSPRPHEGKQIAPWSE